MAALDGAVRGRIKVVPRNHLASHPVLLGQLMQCVLHFDVQGPRQFIGEVSVRRTIDKGFGGGQQRSELREPDVGLRPQPMLVESDDFAQGIVSPAMRVAGEVIQRPELAEDGDIDGGTEGLLQLVEGSDLVVQQQRAQCIGAEGNRPHNVIVPTWSVSPDRNYNKSNHPLQLTTKQLPAAILLGMTAFYIFEIRAAAKAVMTEKR